METGLRGATILAKVRRQCLGMLLYYLGYGGYCTTDGMETGLRKATILPKVRRQGLGRLLYYQRYGDMAYRGYYST